MVVVGHQAVSMNNRAIAFMGFSEIFQEFLSVPFALVDVLSLIPPGCHMVKRPGKGDP